MKLPLTVINLWAGPGAGKSTAAAGLFNLMKNSGHKVELITEVAKDLTYEDNKVALGNQLLLLGLQDQRLRRLVGQVDFAITDSPLPLGMIYVTPEYRKQWLHAAIWGAFDRYRNVNVRVVRTKPYASYGRSQTEDAAQAIDHDIQYWLLPRAGGEEFAANGDLEAPALIYKFLQDAGVFIHNE